MRSSALVTAKKYVNPVIGIDVAEDKFDVAITSAAKTIYTFENTVSGRRKFIASIKPLKSRLVLMEASGKCEIRIALALQKAAIPFRIENPAKLKNFNRAMGIIEKTDSIDALTIALAAEQLNIQPSLNFLDPFIIKLKENIRLRGAMMIEKLRHENRLKRLLDKPLIKCIKSFIAKFKKFIVKLDVKIKRMINSNTAAKEKYELLTTAPNVGFVTAVSVIAECPEIGCIGRRQISKLAGLAPIANDSGKITGKRHIRGGRQNIRGALYMSVLSAMQKNPLIKRFYDKLREKGKPAKVAMTACAHKLLLLLNAMVKLKRPWAEFYKGEPV